VSSCAFLYAKGLNAKNIYKEMFTVESVCRVKFSLLSGKRFTDHEELKMEVWKWMRQESKDFYAAGFDTLEKRSVSVLVENM
jgi:hypothetical protein